jgi:hypothetical protein
VSGASVSGASVSGPRSQGPRCERRSGSAGPLEEVRRDWLLRGPLALLLELVQRVWLIDLARHDPILGDDAQTLGILASRNLCNLAVERLRGARGVVAKDRRTLEVTYGGRLLHVGKAPSDLPSWDVMSMDWSSSEVRDDAARVNSAAYYPIQGTLFDPLPPREVGGDRPTGLSHLHLTWQGFADGSTRAWLGFPRLGIPPWFAVTALDLHEISGRPLHAHDPPPQPHPADTAEGDLQPVELPAAVLGVLGQPAASV